MFRRCLMAVSSARCPRLINIRSLAVPKKEEKKIEKLKSLRTAVIDFHEAHNKTKTIDWDKLREFLAESGHSHKSNFEFVLLSAFDLDLDDAKSTASLNRDLFQSIVELVQNSAAVRDNKIAALRLCVFLSNFPDYLSEEQCAFIKTIADGIVKDGTSVVPIRQDIFQALAKSSAANCRHAYDLFPSLVSENDPRDFSLKINMINQLAASSIRFGLLDHLAKLVSERHQLIELDSSHLGELMQRLNATSSLERDDLLNYFELLHRLYVPLPLDSMPRVTQLLKNRLKFTNIKENVAISRDGLCACCGTQLEGLSRLEYEQLRSLFRSIIFDRSEEYLMANLSEFEEQLHKFEALVRTEPRKDKPKFDLVVDGLNVGYNRSSSLQIDSRGLRSIAKIYKSKDTDQQLVRILSSAQVLQSHNRILLIGRQHMKKWSKLMVLLARNSDRIVAKLLKNQTRDDNYILLAAIQHPNTFILTGDLFRDHRQKFRSWYLSEMGPVDRPNLHHFFVRWLHSRQIKFDRTGVVSLPNQFDAKIHFDKKSKTIHLPIVVEVDEVQQENHRIEWICARP